MALHSAWQVCADLFCDAVESQAGTARREPERELLFCLLGGHGVTYELARSAAEVIGHLEPFSMERDREELMTLLVETLRGANFGPPRVDGSLRRYRYPERKAEMITQAREWLGEVGGLEQAVALHGDLTAKRRLLCTCPGIGPKTASWLLRNLGWADRVAVVDVHVLRLLIDLGYLGEYARMPRDYELAEQQFLALCREFDAPPAAFDLFAWEWQRGTLWPKSTSL